MPNWCENIIEISHDDPKMIEKFVEAFNKEEVGNTFRPQPDFTTTPVPSANSEIKAHFEEDPVKKAGILKNEGTIREGSWWDWNIMNWGTKWDFGYENQKEKWDGSNELSKLFFMTAWSPPIELYEYMTSEHGFHIYGEFLELGMDFLGKWESGIGEIETTVPHSRDELHLLEKEYPLMYSAMEQHIEWVEEQEEEEREFDRKQKEIDKAA